MQRCPACGSNRVFRSKARTALERFRRQFSMKRPYRCHACNWRGWAHESAQTASLDIVPDAVAPAPDLGAIDVSLDEAGKSGDSKDQG